MLTSVLYCDDSSDSMAEDLNPERLPESDISHIKRLGLFPIVIQLKQMMDKMLKLLNC